MLRALNYIVQPAKPNCEFALIIPWCRRCDWRWGSSLHLPTRLGSSGWRGLHPSVQVQSVCYGKLFVTLTTSITFTASIEQQISVTGGSCNIGPKYIQ